MKPSLRESVPEGMNRRNMRRIIIALTTLGLLAGCAGTKFTRLEGDTLVLGQTTEAKIREHLGKPYSVGSLVKNGETLRLINYSYSYVPPYAIFLGGDMRIKTQAFYFYGEKLVGHVYLSSWKDSDKTNFDETKVGQIKEGTTTVDEVIRLLGPPSGEYIYPMIEDKDWKAIGYFFFNMHLGLKPTMHEEILKVSYNKTRVVTKVEFSAATS